MREEERKKVVGGRCGDRGGEEKNGIRKDNCD